MKVVGGAVAGATAAVTAFGASSVKVGMEFDSAMSQVAATMGDKAHDMVEYNGETVDSMVALRDFAQEMGSTTAFSATQASEGLNYMALAGYDAATAMKTLPSVLNLAAAGGMELGTASDMVTDAMSALGLEAKDATMFVDQMAATSSNSNTSVAQLGEAILTVGATAKQLAGGTTELNTVLGILADNGTKGAEGGTRLRNIMLALGSPIDKAKEALDDLGVSAYDSEGNMKPLQSTLAELNNAMSDFTQEEKTKTLNTIFNKVDLADVNYLLGVQTERWGDLRTSIQGAWYTTDALSESFKNNGMSLEDIQTKLEGLGVSAEDIKWAFDVSGGSAEEFIQAIWESGAQVENYDDILKTLGVDLSTLQDGFTDATGAAQAMADTQLDNLAGDVTLFKSALEGAQIIISDGLAPELREFVQFGTDGLSRMTTAFKEGGLSGAMDEFSKIVAEGVDMLIKMASDLVRAGVTLLEALIQGLSDNSDVVISAVVDIIGILGKAILDNLPLIFEAGLQIILGLALALGENADEIIPSVVDCVLTIVDSLIDNADLLIDAAIAIILGLADGLIAAQDKLLVKIPELVGKIVTALIKNAPKLALAAVELLLALGKGMIQYIQRLLEYIPRVVSQVINGFNKTDWSSIGHNIIEGVKNGIMKRISGLVDTVKGAASSVLNAWKGVFDIHSPSKKFAWMADMCIAGFDNEFKDYDPYETLDDSFKTNAKSLQASFVGSVGNMAGVDLSAIGGYVRSAIEGMAVVMDSKPVGMLVANSVNAELGRIAMRGAYV